MVKQVGNKGFTMIEMMLTLFVVSIIALISFSFSHNDKFTHVDAEIESIQYFFQYAQTEAIDKQSRMIVMGYVVGNKLLLINAEGQIVDELILQHCTILSSGLNQFSYLQNGDTNAFGTFRLNCYGERVDFVFQIQKGRFRIER